MNRSSHLLLAGVCLLACAKVQADGGLVRLSEQLDGYHVTVFTSPNPLRAGIVDISVLLQDAATGTLVRDAAVTVRAVPRGNADAAVRQEATTVAATNKLFRAAILGLSDPGWWDVDIAIEGLRSPIQVHFEMEVNE